MINEVNFPPMCGASSGTRRARWHLLAVFLRPRLLLASRPQHGGFCHHSRRLPGVTRNNRYCGKGVLLVLLLRLPDQVPLGLDTNINIQYVYLSPPYYTAEVKRANGDVPFRGDYSASWQKWRVHLPPPRRSLLLSSALAHVLCFVYQAKIMAKELQTSLRSHPAAVG